jgi:hypothetical protein
MSVLLPATVLAQRHLALVMGNADYTDAPLRNPVNDAQDMAQSLRDLGFQVIEARNAPRRAMLEAVNSFGVRLQQADVGVFYYSGHGVQYQGTNYLIPLHALIAAPADLEQEAVDVRRILGRMEQSSTTLNIVILDACRNNPFRHLLAFRSFGVRGLAPLPRVRSSLIAYATQPDNVAEDGRGRNGTYTKHLLRYLKQPGLSLPDLFSEVGRAVLQETHNQQEPWVSFSPLPRFCFAGCAPSSPSARLTGPETATGPEKISQAIPGGWKRYRHPTYGFTFEYPALYGEAPSDCGLREDADGLSLGYRSQLSFYEAHGMTLEAFVNKHIKAEHRMITALSPQTVGGLDALKVEYRFGGLNRHGTFTAVAAGRLIYVFEFTAGGFCEKAGIDELTAYGQMIDTFRLEK